MISTKKGMIKSAGVVAIATLISRILGFVRDILIAGFFGTGVSAQAFVVAFRIPNLLRDLVGEGSTNAVVVPILSEYSAKKSRKDFWELSSIFLTTTFIILTLISILGILFSPFIVHLIAPGFYVDKTKFNLTVELTQVMFPYILLIGLTALCMGISNTFGHFFAPAFGPCLLNLSVIGGALLLVPHLKEGSFGLAIGVLIGGVAQLSFQLPFLFQKGMRLKFKFRLNHPEVRQAGRLLLPRVVGSAAYQFSILIDTIVGSISRVVGEGGVAALYYANRLIQFPLAIFGISMAMVSLPTMSYHATANDREKLKGTVLFSLRSIFLVMIPASVGLIVLGIPITECLFKRGAFDEYSTNITYYCLALYSLGLVSYGGSKILSSAFYALKDTVTPLKASIVCLALNLILNLILMWPMKIGGIALATSISSLVNLILLFISLRKRLGPMDEPGLFNLFVRILCASILMGIYIYFVWMGLLRIGVSSIINLIFTILTGIGVYSASCLIFKVDELSQFLKWILKIR